MSAQNFPEDAVANASHEEMMSALFANMVLQQTNMAMMFLGKVPHPETGEDMEDLETAKMFIDQLEMLAVKTKGNLDKREEGLLKQSLMAVRMAFVEAIDKPQKHSGAAISSPEASSESRQQPPPVVQAPGPPSRAEDSTEELESRKKFTKKY